MFLLGLKMTCYECLKEVVYLFDDGRCKDCTRLVPEEVQGLLQFEEEIEE